MQHAEDVDWAGVVGPNSAALSPIRIVDQAAVGALSPAVFSSPRYHHHVCARRDDDVVGKDEDSVGEARAAEGILIGDHVPS